MINWEASLLHKKTCHWSLSSTALVSTHFKHAFSSQKLSLNAVCKESNPDGWRGRSWAPKKEVKTWGKACLPLLLFFATYLQSSSAMGLRTRRSGAAGRTWPAAPAFGHVTLLQTQCSRSPCWQRQSLSEKSPLQPCVIPALVHGRRALPASPSWAREAEFVITQEWWQPFSYQGQNHPDDSSACRLQRRYWNTSDSAAWKIRNTTDHRDSCLVKYSLSSHSLHCKITSPCLKLFFQVFP